MKDSQKTLRDKKEKIETYLASLPRGEQDLLHDSMAYSLNGGGAVSDHGGALRG